jgi:hypothetical protein
MTRRSRRILHIRSGQSIVSRRPGSTRYSRDVTNIIENSHIIEMMKACRAEIRCSATAAGDGNTKKVIWTWDMRAYRVSSSVLAFTHTGSIDAVVF